MPELNTLAFDCVLQHFTAAVGEPYWLSLDFHMVRRLLRHDGINCRSELCVLEAAARWLAADWPQREAHGEALLVCVRRGLLTPSEAAVLPQQAVLARYPRLRALFLQYPAVPVEAQELYLLHSDALEAATTPREPHEAVMLFGGWCQELGPRAACQVGCQELGPRAAFQVGCQEFGPRAACPLWGVWSLVLGLRVR